MNWFFNPNDWLSVYLILYSMISKLENGKSNEF